MQDVYNIHIFMILWDTITKQDFIVTVVKILVTFDNNFVNTSNA